MPTDRKGWRRLTGIPVGHGSYLWWVECTRCGAVAATDEGVGLHNAWHAEQEASSDAD